MSNTISIKDLITSYGIHTLKMKCSASGYTDSDYSEQTINYQPLISFDTINEAIIFSHVIPSVTEYKIYGESILLGTFTTSQASTDDISISCSSLGINLDDYSYYSLTTTINGQTYTTGNIYMAKIYGVSGLYDSSPLLTRTDDAVGMTYAFESSTGVVSSDFDDVFPYNRMTRVTIDGNVFVRVPSMWFRVGADSNNRITDIAVSEQRRGTGNWYKTDEFYYGAYCGNVNSSKLRSVSGVTPSGDGTLSQFRAYATNNGSGYQQLDLYHKTIMNFLWLIEFANKNSQELFPMTYTSKLNTGGTDSLTTPSGFLTSNKRFRWHYIEDFFGNMAEALDGVTGNSLASADPSIYNDNGTNYNTLGYTVTWTEGSYIKALGWDNNNPFLCMPAEIGGGGSTYFCDCLYGTLRQGNWCFCGGDYGGHYMDVSGLFFLYQYNTYGAFGARLLYKPVS